MSVIKFEATVEDGKIVIPKKFRGQIQGEVEVVVRPKMYNAEQEEKNFLREMIENPIYDPNFVPFTRDEIYDRT